MDWDHALKWICSEPDSFERDVLRYQLKWLNAHAGNDGQSFLTDYSFEVFWKNELSARVTARKGRVHVSRFIIHPIRQLFWSDSITRNQLNEALKLRCFDPNRSDAQDKLKALGLQEYNPLEIVKRTHGVSYNDYIWIRFPGEKLRAEDVLVREPYAVP